MPAACAKWIIEQTGRHCRRAREWGGKVRLAEGQGNKAMHKGRGFRARKGACTLKALGRQMKISARVEIATMHGVKDGVQSVG
eukprot:1161645-Pelagomonas_calceolata.AAC.12